jgi:hypothetical protein
MRRCVDENESCSLAAPEDFLTLTLTQSDWEAKCSAQRPFLLRGACEDGKQVLTYSTGYNGERRVYDRTGEFLSVVEFTDTGSSPCYGQGYWPIFPQCENPTVVETFCSASDLGGEPMPIWMRPENVER